MLKFNTVIFDVDSTLVSIEGLDYIAKNKGIGAEIEKITKGAMNGNLPMAEAMKYKMDAIAPSCDDMVGMGKAYIQNLTEGAIEVVDKLQENGIDVWILSGNFQPAVGILASHLKIPSEKVIGNTVFFDEAMKYKGFDEANLLGKNGGKGKIIRKHKKDMGNTVFIGDGSTDVEAKNEVDLFIGFGGVVKRSRVKALSDIYIEEPNLKAILPLIIS